MKPVSFKIPASNASSFRLEIDEGAHFYDRLHHHSELQISLIVKSEGSLFVGDSMSIFNTGDLIVIGANVPHLLRNEALYYALDSPGAKAISIFFSEKSFGTAFFQLPELALVRQFMQAAQRSFRITGITKEKVSAKMEAMPSKNGFDRLLLLWEILRDLSESKDLTFLSTAPYLMGQNPAESRQINRVFQYCMDHYQEPIRLEEMAQLANLSVSSFCRYFKLRTRKTFVQFLNEVRVAAACKQLDQTDYSISEICYQVGFNNVSNFNRQFKKMMQVTPTEYSLRMEEREL